MEKMGVEGSFVALITLLNSDGTVDFDGFRTRIDFQASNGTNALSVMGSTGEVSMLSQKERQRIISETLKFKKGDILLF